MELFCMKHENVFKKVRKLINEREIDESNLDTAFDLLEEIIEKDSTCDWAFGLISEIYYWTGEFAEPEDKLFNFEHGVNYGEKGVEANENSLEANFWLSVNYGSFGSEKGIMKSLELIKPIKKHAEKVIEIDESYFYGGPWRVLGRLYHKAPGFPFSVGDTKKGIECLEKALEFGPKFYLNHLFIAEAYQSASDKQKAREHLEWIINAPLNKNHEIEDTSYKKDAQAMLNKL
jgi:tetratricopeptide (TPR) repeat protein